MKKIVLLFIVSTMVMTGLAGESEKEKCDERPSESVSKEILEVPSASIEALERRFYAKYGKIIIEESKENKKEAAQEADTKKETEKETESTTVKETQAQETQTQETTQQQVESETVTQPPTEPETVAEVQTEPPVPEETQPETVPCAAGIAITQYDYNQLLSIVEAEAGDQDDVGKILVANVIFNRVRNAQFPNTVTEVIYQNGNGVYQFEPVLNGRIYSVGVTDSTVSCVNRAMAGEDYSQGALYFTMKTSPGSWFNTSLRLLFVHGDHYFYTC